MFRRKLAGLHEASYTVETYLPSTAYGDNRRAVFSVWSFPDHYCRETSDKRAPALSKVWSAFAERGQEDIDPRIVCRA